MHQRHVSLPSTQYFEVDMWLFRKSPDDADADADADASSRDIIDGARMAVLEIVTNLVQDSRMAARIPEGGATNPLPVFVCGCLRGPVEPQTLTVRDALGLMDSKVSMLTQAFAGMGPSPDACTLTVSECRIASLQLCMCTARPRLRCRSVLCLQGANVAIYLYLLQCWWRTWCA
jgi:hypothetical protein